MNERAAMAPPSVDPRWQVQTDASGRAVFADRTLNQLRAGQQVASTIAPNGPAQPTLPPSEAPPPPAPEA